MSGAARWCRNSPSRGCVRRAAGGDAKIARKLRHFAHQADEAVAPAAGTACLALLLDRPANLVTTREAVDLGAMLGELRKQISEIFQLLGDNVNDARFFLHARTGLQAAGRVTAQCTRWSRASDLGCDGVDGTHSPHPLIESSSRPDGPFRTKSKMYPQ